ncbi:B3 domain-containing protein REM21-like [Chenopodium quinoa]|uniref:B3 domain-containing protein REM21-like n=1 Tax=Chenopodium quinoa TaxID=63459 RepID=UPI000B78178B|nr:B3 domain-containing protein REM21-like [Chenopodium quinoa]
MDYSRPPWFQFMVAPATRHRLFVPERVRELLNSPSGKFYVILGSRGEPYPLVIRLRESSHQWRCFIEDGWTNFLNSNEIKNGDVVEMFYCGRHYFRALVYRKGREFKGENEVEEKDSSSDDELTQIEKDPPIFNATFTVPYIRAERLYVPVNFAREFVNGFPEYSHVQLVVKYKVWDALLKITYDHTHNIKKCIVKSVVKQMIFWENIQPGQKMIATCSFMFLS